jgi:hypothetical protein
MRQYWYLGFCLAVIFWPSVYTTANYETSLSYDKPLTFDDECGGTTLNTARWDTCYP